MLDTPALRIEQPPAQTLISSSPYDKTLGGLTGLPNWSAGSAQWIANDDRHEVEKINRAAKTLLAEYATLLRPAIRQGILAQTDAVMSPEDWEDDDTLPSLDSYRCMLKGLVELAPNSRPNLSVSCDGHMTAGWFSDNSRAVFEFYPNERVSWVISKSLDGDVDRAVGIEPILRIRAIAEAHAAAI